jgi:hypothetical protein
MKPSFMLRGLKVECSAPIIIDSKVRGKRLYPRVYRVGKSIYVISSLGVKVSKDGGQTWRERTDEEREIAFVGTIANSPDNLHLRYRERAYYKDGVMTIEGLRINNWRKADKWYDIPVYGVPALDKEAIQLGRSERSEGNQFRISRRIIIREDGRYLMAAVVRFKDDKRSSVILLASDDQAESFYYMGTIAEPKDAPWGSEGCTEPFLLRYPSGRLICVMRTGVTEDYRAQPMLLASSENGGETWETRRMSLKGVMPKLALMENGVLACSVTRPGNNVAFSTDGGESWTGEIVLSSPDLGTSAAMNLEPVGTNQLLAVYEVHNWRPQKFWLWEPPKAKKAVVGRIVTVERL